MAALDAFEVTVTFCFTPEQRGLAPHHTSPPVVAEEFAEFCAGMVRRYTTRQATDAAESMLNVGEARRESRGYETGSHNAM